MRKVREYDMAGERGRIKRLSTVRIRRRLCLIRADATKRRIEEIGRAGLHGTIRPPLLQRCRALTVDRRKIFLAILRYKLSSEEISANRALTHTRGFLFRFGDAQPGIAGCYRLAQPRPFAQLSRHLQLNFGRSQLTLSS